MFMYYVYAGDFSAKKGAPHSGAETGQLPCNSKVSGGLTPNFLSTVVGCMWMHCITYYGVSCLNRVEILETELKP